MKRTTKVNISFAYAISIFAVWISIPPAWGSSNAMKWIEQNNLYLAANLDSTIAGFCNLDDYLDLNFNVIESGSLYVAQRAKALNMPWLLWDVRYNNFTLPPFGWDDELGYVVGDELGYLQFPMIADNFTAIRAAAHSATVILSSRLNGYGADKTATYGGPNPTGNYASDDPAVRYHQALQDFIAICHPDYLVNARYPFQDTSEDFNEYWFDDVMIVREVAQAAGLPYFMMLQAYENTIADRRVPSDSDVRYEKFACLTMGYKGFSHWWYSVQPNGNMSNYVPCFYDVNTGGKAPFYYSVKESNAEVLALGGTLKDLTSTQVAYLPGVGKPLPSGIGRWTAGSDHYGYITNLRCVSDNTTDLFIGYFEDNASGVYAMICNTNHGKDLTAQDTQETVEITFAFSGTTIKGIQRISRVDGHKEDLALSGNKLTLTLPGGTGDLLKFNIDNTQSYTVAYWRFDDDPYAVDVPPAYSSPVNVTGSWGLTSSTVAGSGNPGPGPFWRSDVPMPIVPLTGQTNTKCLELGMNASYYPSTGMVQVPSGYSGLRFDPSLGGNPVFTAECWIKKDAGSTGGYRTIFQKEGGYTLRIDPTGKLQAGILRTNDYDLLISSSSSVLDSNWHHVAAIFDTHAGLAANVQLFIDGIEDGTITGDVRSSYSYISGTSEFIIGATRYGSYPYVGKIDELRITSGIPAKFLNMWPASSGGVVAWWRFDPDNYTLGVAPAAGAQVNVTGNGAVQSWTVASAGNPATGPLWSSDVPQQVLSLDGRDDTRSLEFDVVAGSPGKSTGFVQVPADVTALQFNPALGRGGVFTAECWVKKDAASTNGSRYIFIKNGGYGLRINDNNTLSACLLKANNDDALVRTSVTMLDNAWHHVAAVYDTRPGRNDVSLYLDGTVQGTITDNAGVDYIPSPGPFCLGAWLSGDFAFKGNLDELKITEGELPASQFLNYVETPSWQEQYVNTMGYWRFDHDGYANGQEPPANGIIRDEIGVIIGSVDPTSPSIHRPNYDATTVPVNPVPATGQPNALCLYFDGNDYLSFWTGYFAFGPKVFSYVFTLEGYVKREGSGIYQTIFFKRNGFVLGIDTANKLYASLTQTDSDSDFYEVRWDTPLDTNWHHVAAIYYTYPGTAARIELYLDGVAGGACVLDQRSSYSYANIGGEVKMGSWLYGQYGFRGRLDEFRLTAGKLSPSQFLRSVPELPSQISGGVDLRDFSGDKTIVPVTLEIRNPGDPTPRETHTVALDTAGHYAFTTMLKGTYDVAAKAAHWLRQRQPNIDTRSNVVVNFSLINGDCDGDNEITSTDLSIVLAAMNALSGYSNWDPQADLDGDGKITSTDLSINLASMDWMGD